MPFVCGYRPSSFGDLEETINHLITYHHDSEKEKKRKYNTLLQTLNFRIVPEMCHGQDRELSINDSVEITQELKPN